jgi:hypothetical protein
MITYENKDFEGNHFALQVITRGSYVDSGVNPEKLFVIETTTIRLNYVALNDYYGSIDNNCREVYKDGEYGDQEYEEYKTKCAERHAEWERKIKSAIGIDEADKSIFITQAHSEVFTVVHIWGVQKSQGETQT